MMALPAIFAAFPAVAAAATAGVEALAMANFFRVALLASAEGSFSGDVIGVVSSRASDKSRRV